MARKYVLSRERNQKVQKYLALSRDGKLDTLDEDAMTELAELKSSLS